MKVPLFGIWLVLIAGCALQSYRQLPAKYTELPAAPPECYLISAEQAFGAPVARRFDFDERDTIVSVTIHPFDLQGPRPTIHRVGEEASRLRAILRGFDWNAVEPSGNRDAMYVDDVAVTFKARTPRSYREASGGMAECKALGALFRIAMQ